MGRQAARGLAGGRVVGQLGSQRVASRRGIALERRARVPAIDAPFRRRRPDSRSGTRHSTSTSSWDLSGFFSDSAKRKIDDVVGRREADPDPPQAFAKLVTYARRRSDDRRDPPHCHAPRQSERPSLDSRRDPRASRGLRRDPQQRPAGAAEPVHAGRRRAPGRRGGIGGHRVLRRAAGRARRRTTRSSCRSRKPRVRWWRWRSGEAADVRTGRAGRAGPASDAGDARRSSSAGTPSQSPTAATALLRAPALRQQGGDRRRSTRRVAARRLRAPLRLGARARPRALGPRRADRRLPGQGRRCRRGARRPSPWPTAIATWRTTRRCKRTPRKVALPWRRDVVAAVPAGICSSCCVDRRGRRRASLVVAVTPQRRRRSAALAALAVVTMWPIGDLAASVSLTVATIAASRHHAVRGAAAPAWRRRRPVLVALTRPRLVGHGHADRWPTPVSRIALVTVLGTATLSAPVVVDWGARSGARARRHAARGAARRRRALDSRRSP